MGNRSFNHENFQRMEEEIEDLEKLVSRLTAELALNTKGNFKADDTRTSTPKGTESKRKG